MTKIKSNKCHVSPATDHPPSNSSTMLSRLVHQDRTPKNQKYDTIFDKKPPALSALVVDGGDNTQHIHNPQTLHLAKGPLKRK